MNRLRRYFLAIVRPIQGFVTEAFLEDLSPRADEVNDIEKPFEEKINKIPPITIRKAVNRHLSTLFCERVSEPFIAAPLEGTPVWLPLQRKSIPAAPTAY